MSEAISLRKNNAFTVFLNLESGVLTFSFSNNPLYDYAPVTNILPAE